ncbi:hypothetical protein V6N11_026026 [Hibiscus sabdariffa]|uniref:PB1-like domain-containing protein n=1 Tax=Hibiscus sabdariffa TaxID=183260 RepID=A0ABR2SUG0_9ROSI
MTRVRREEDKPGAIYETNSSKFTTVVHHGGSFYRTPELIYTGQLIDYFDRCDVDEMSIFEMIDMVEKLGLTYTMKIFWLVSEKPFEVKLLANDNDVLEMVSKLPRNHYVHVYLEEVLTACSDANVEPDCNVEVSDVGSFEPEINVEVSDVAVSDDAIVSDDDSLEENIGEPSEIRVEPNSDSEDIDYEASKSSTHEFGFTDSDAEASDDVSDVHAGVGDKVKITRPSLTMHQDQSTTPRPSQSDISTPSSRPNHSDIPTPTLRPSQSHHPQSNIPRPSQPLPPPYNVRWMPTPTVPFTQESYTATPTQSGIHPQINIPRPSQPLPPPYNVRWMPNPTVPFTQESHTATPTQSDIHPQINISSPSQPIPLTQESSVTQPSPQDLGENRLRSDP